MKEKHERSEVFIILNINLNKLNKQWGPIITNISNEAYNLTQNHKNYSHFTRHRDPYTITFDDPTLKIKTLLEND